MNPHIYLHEIIRTVPGGRSRTWPASCRCTTTRPARPAHDTGRSVSSARVATSGPWPGVINIWEKTWAGQTEDLVAPVPCDAQRDAAMEQWWNRNLHLRRGGYDRILIPTDDSPTLADLETRGVTGEVFGTRSCWLPFGSRAGTSTRWPSSVPALDAVRPRPRRRIPCRDAAAPGAHDHRRAQWSALARSLARRRRTPVGVRNEYRVVNYEQAESSCSSPRCRRQPLPASLTQERFCKPPARPSRIIQMFCRRPTPEGPA